jgi:branched-chain amino acid aminotransferase
MLIDGLAGDRLPVTDALVVRGDGVFEAVRSYDGCLFLLDRHLDRLERSAAAMGLKLPERSEIVDWAESAGRDGDGIVRIIVSRGGSVPGADDPERCLVFKHPLPRRREQVTLGSVTAPWHPAGAEWELAGVKTTSYAPNAAATRRAQAAGANDALLVSVGGVVLEGPTFSIGWVVEGRLETPALDLGILDSITRRVVLDLAIESGVQVVESEFRLADLIRADEVMAWSTVKEVTPVVEVDGLAFPVGPMTGDLRRSFRRFQESVVQGGASTRSK